MGTLRLNQNRGIYSLVTTFLFITVVLFVVLSVVFLNQYMVLVRERLDDELGKKEDIMSAKNKILSKVCYGNQVDENHIEEVCEFPKEFISGYTIEKIPYKNCSNESKIWNFSFVGEHVDLSSIKNEVYFITIKDNETGFLCPGILRVMYE